MAKFHGKVGYATPSTETKPGVWVEGIVEIEYFGDVLRNTRAMRDGENSINPNLSVGNSISVVADEYANTNFFAIRFVEWAGVVWTVTDVEVQSPRLILRLGEVYNGRRAADFTA